MQQSLIECRKKERALDQKLSEQGVLIADLKRQVSRTSEINKSLVDKLKERDLLLESLEKDKDFYHKEAQMTAN